MGEKRKAGKKNADNGKKSVVSDVVSDDEIAEISRKHPHNPLAAVKAIDDLYIQRTNGFSLKP